MSVVVERGLARCPRCVAVADYTFVESGPNAVRYEVRCRKCGEAYTEVNTPVLPGFSAKTPVPAVFIPDATPQNVGARRARALARLAHLARSLAGSTIVTRMRRRRAEPPTSVSQP